MTLDREVKKQNLLAFLRSAFKPIRLLVLVILILIVVPLGTILSQQITVLAMALIFSGYLAQSYILSIPQRFRSQLFYEHWKSCESRHRRLMHGLKQLRKRNIADLSELPVSSKKLRDGLYSALRRADLLQYEVQKSERSEPPRARHLNYIQDRQAQELFRVAEKNKSEYNQRMSRLLAGVHRAVAQADVYISTLDTLRVRILDYRLLGEKPEADSYEFLTAVTEAKMQFEAIDSALEEIELTPFPETVVVVPDKKLTESPPPVPTDDEHQEHNS